MHKFFIYKDQILNDKITIIGDDVNHIVKVLRLRPEDQIIACDRQGSEYECLIKEINKKEVICSIKSSYCSTTEAPVKITLFQGIPKAAKMDLIIQKCVELGVVEIYPVITERVIVKLYDKDMKNKLDRWNRISEEAAKQSNRGMIPIINSPVDINKAIEYMSRLDFNIMPYEKETAIGLKKAIKEARVIKSAGIFIGPEGGFDETEVELCVKNSIIPITLGPRILRTETAGFTAAALLQYEAGDMGGVK